MNRSVSPVTEDTGTGLMALAARLCAQSGRLPPVRLTRLEGGKNNRVFRLDLEDGSPLVLKSYFTDPRDPRDRLNAEWRFVTHAWSCGVRALPEPIAADTSGRCALYSFVPGRKLSADELRQEHVAAAVDFVCAVNAQAQKTSSPDAGSEACFSLAEHLATVERRVDRLTGLDPEAPLADEAQEFVTRQLVPAWARVKEKIHSDIARSALDPDQRLEDASTCLSPSDFGFHNALLGRDNKLVFLDFEYAGRDDPAKLTCDFFCQPEIPVSMDHFDFFLHQAAGKAGFDEPARLRCRLLLDAYRIKWTCIILNDFLPVGATRRAFADLSAHQERSAMQLQRATRKLAGIVMHLEHVCF